MRALLVATMAAAACAAALVALAPTPAAATTPVGRVTSVSGAGRLLLDRPGAGAIVPLRKNDRLHLGDTLVVGRGAKATLRLTRPPGRADPELVYVRGAPGVEPVVVLRRESARVTVVRISA